MSEMSEAFLPVTKLRGRENYTTWKIAMENLLSLDGLWTSVLGTEENEEKIVKAKAKIVSSVDETLYIHVAKAATAAEAWRNLRKAFEDTGLTRKVSLLRKMTTTRLENCENIEGYVNEIMSAAHRSTAIGCEINQEWLGTVLLAGLAEKYGPMIMALESSGMVITGDSVKTKLLRESSCYDKSKTSMDGDSAYHVKRRFRGAKSRPPFKNVECWNCDKQGRISSECYGKKKDDKEGKDEKRPEREKKKNDSSVKVAFLANNEVSDEGWIIDSAASVHMTPDEKSFSSIIAINEYVVVADNKKLRVEGKGSVTISGLVNN
jgi:hypothetical protein